MSDPKKPTPPSSGSGAAPTCSPTLPCATPSPTKCCCCVTSAAIENVRYFGNPGITSPNTGSPLSNGHIFDFRIEMNVEK